MASAYDDDVPAQSADRVVGEESMTSREKRQLIWSQENSGAIADYNSMVAMNGILLAQFRKF